MTKSKPQNLGSSNFEPDICTLETFRSFFRKHPEDPSPTELDRTNIFHFVRIRKRYAERNIISGEGN